ncbi:hypothetical protein [Capnocytophaga leadbetteri]|nr:hypothetical protein [Capnocytophaga leadbetteri]
MKYFICTLLCVCSWGLSAQEDNTFLSKWGIEFGASVGRAQLTGNELALNGMTSNGNWLVSYYATERVRFQTGITMSLFSNGSLTADNYYNTNATFIGIPVKIVFSKIEIAPKKAAIVLGIGVQANKAINYQLETKDFSKSTSSGSVFLGVPMSLGVESKLSDNYTLGFYLSTQVVTKSYKNYRLQNNGLLRVAVSYRL